MNTYRLIKKTCLHFSVFALLSLLLSSFNPAPEKFSETITDKDGNKVSFDMVLIPGGEFLMGSPESDPDRFKHEGSQVRVKLDPFYLCTTETTLELFMIYYEETVSNERDTERSANDVDANSGATPVYGDIKMGYDIQHPAIGMTWLNAVTFCKWLSEKTGKTYVLPTEAQWEYACRSGSEMKFGVTDNPDEMGEYAWYDENSEQATHPVAQKKPNAYGLYDMQGNVSEWVQDFYSPTAYAEAGVEAPLKNPMGPESGDVHVARGGSYEAYVEDLRCAQRFYEQDWWRFGDPQVPKSRWWLPEMDIIGFRIALIEGSID